MPIAFELQVEAGPYIVLNTFGETEMFGWQTHAGLRNVKRSPCNFL